jgi:NAD-dependent dihydropyrimidine dehydrogenase PreA subunit
MKIKRKIIEIDENLCDGCGQCVPSCAEGALQIIDGKARLIAEIYCDGLGACLGECPTGALKIVEREAEDFDEEAVGRHLSSIPAQEASQKTDTRGCPGSQIQTFGSSESCKEANIPSTLKTGSSDLSHWPVQIRLVPPTAPFLRGEDLLVVADCVPVAYPNFHRDFIKGKAVLMGCPKFDNAQEYVEKLADIFKAADIKSITVPVMEVPCCQGLPVIIEKGMELAGKKIPVKKVVIGMQGEIL